VIAAARNENPAIVAPTAEIQTGTPAATQRTSSPDETAAAVT
jgi:hypothetical protein